MTDSQREKEQDLKKSRNRKFGFSFANTEGMPKMVKECCGAMGDIEACCGQMQKMCCPQPEEENEQTEEKSDSD